MSATKAVAWNMSIQPSRMVISIGAGVESGWALVPDEACISIAPTKFEALPFIFIGIDISDCWAEAKALIPNSRAKHRVYTEFLPSKNNERSGLGIRSVAGWREKLRFAGGTEEGTLYEVLQETAI